MFIPSFTKVLFVVCCILSFKAQGMALLHSKDTRERHQVAITLQRRYGMSATLLHRIAINSVDEIEKYWVQADQDVLNLSLKYAAVCASNKAAEYLISKGALVDWDTLRMARYPLLQDKDNPALAVVSVGPWTKK